MQQHGAATEAAIELASVLKNEAEALLDAYEQLPVVLDRERAAIKTGELRGVEEVGLVKAALGDKIEAAFNGLTGVAQRLTRLHDQRCVSLKDCIAGLDAIAAKLPEGGLAPQVLKHQLTGLRAVSARLDAAVPVVQPQIEANKVLLQTMLESYQESYRFWHQVAEETTAAYTAKGVQQAAGRTSAFRARA